MATATATATATVTVTVTATATAMATATEIEAIKITTITKVIRLSSSSYVTKVIYFIKMEDTENYVIPRGNYNSCAMGKIKMVHIVLNLFIASNNDNQIIHWNY